MTAFGTAYCILGALILVVSALRARRFPNAISNGFGLELALMLLADGSLFLGQGAGLAENIMSVTSAIFYGQQIIYAVLGVALLVNGVYTIRREGASLTHVLPIGWGILLLVVVYWFMLGPGWATSGSEFFVMLVNALNTLVSYIPFALLGALISNAICHRMRKTPETEYVVVLGCAIMKDGTVTPLLRGRCDAAIKAWKDGGQKAKIICSGGQGPNEVISEAQAMASYCISQGVPEADVLLEDKSTTTEENLRFSKAIMDARGGASRCTIATNSYHCLRAAMFARREGLNAVCAGGRTAAFYYPAAFFREYVALVVRNRYAIVFFAVFALVKGYLLVQGLIPQGFFI